MPPKKGKKKGSRPVRIKTNSKSFATSDEEEEKNLEFWDDVQKTDPAFTKKSGFGRNFTSINSQYQMKMATKKLGMFGTDKFNVSDEDFRLIDVDDILVCLYTAKLNYSYDDEEGTIQIASDIELNPKRKTGQKYEGDWAKKAQTDALTKGLSKLGFNADIFFGLYEDRKYIEQITKEFEEE